MCASFFALLTAVVEVDGTRMSHGSAWDQFVCRIWLTRLPLWTFLSTSTYGIILTTVERYAAVIYPVWYKVIIINDEATKKRQRSGARSEKNEIFRVKTGYTFFRHGYSTKAKSMLLRTRTHQEMR